jgi:predicted amidohydrolase YtcJ
MTNADTVVRNCTIIDYVAGRPTKRAGICIRGGRVQACGTEEAVRRAARGGSNMHTYLSLSLCLATLATG